MDAVGTSEMLVNFFYHFMRRIKPEDGHLQNNILKIWKYELRGTRFEKINTDLSPPITIENTTEPDRRNKD
jgi:hypothetical protein